MPAFSPQSGGMRGNDAQGEIAMKQWKNIGQILIDNGILTPKTVARMLAVSKAHNKRFGWTVEKLGLVTGEEMAAALAQQYGLKMAPKIAKFSYPAELLQLIPAEVALQHQLFPLKLSEGGLLLAVSDPTNLKAVENIAANAGLKITPCIATRTEIYAAICKHYLDKDAQEPTGNTVLIVDDEATSRETARQMLAKEPYTVLVAHDGMEGFREVIAEKPHVILTDKVMPKLDGFSLLRSIKAVPEFEAVPVILMSDKLSPEEEMKVFELGFFDYLPKPINRTMLLARVRRAFRFNNQKYGFF